jgi:uncharacterized protein
MRGYIWLSLALVALLPVVAQAQTGRIRTLGEGRVMVSPDTAEATFSVRSEDRQLATAREKAAAAMTKVLEALRGLRIASLTLGTASISVTPLIRQPQGGNVPYPGPNVQIQQQIVGYQVSSTVNARLKGQPAAMAEGISQVVDTALANGATNFYGPSFYREDMTAPNQQALEEATKDAVAKAQALARAAGVTIRNMTYVGMYPEDTQDSMPRPMMAMREMQMGAGGGGGTPTPVEVRDIPVTAQVWVTAAY